MPFNNARKVNVIRGKNLVGAATKEDVDFLLSVIDSFEQQLDTYDEEDYFGTEGWRHVFAGWEE